MSDECTTAPLVGGVALLERAITYTLGSLHLVTPEDMSHPTPCRAWDLRALLGHMDDSLVALGEAIDVGHVTLDASTDDGDTPADPVAALRGRARHVLGAWAHAHCHQVISVGDAPLTTGIVTGAGAIEIAVHGWDVAQACGRNRPIPSPLAGEMLDLSPLLVTEGDRPARFAAPVDVPPLASQGDRLIAFLGRHPPT